jgi:D-beta-D-heptose 7-phosphate kinase/D-beta-D-heptose 1-phosphate adenosyltransferase
VIPFTAQTCYQLAKVGAAMRDAEQKIWTREALAGECTRLRTAGRKIVFTNGAFDLLHAGHATYLQFARRQGDVLIVALNTDASIRRYKGEKRPIVDGPNRARLMAALECVDYVVFFDEDEPKALIAELQPDVLVKAEDWAHYVSGRDIVEARGGKVVLAPMVAGLSTTKLIEKILQAYGAG